MFFYAESGNSDSQTQQTITSNVVFFGNSTLNFNNTCINNTDQVIVNINATGNNTEIITLTDNSDQFTFSPSSFTLSGGASQAITVTFNPTSWGVKNANLIASSSGGNSATASLTGVCVADPLIITSSVGALNFNTTYVSQTSSMTFTVSAGGTVQDIVLMSDDTDQFDFSPTSFSMTGSNQTQEVTVYFTPSSNGSKVGILTLSASGGDVAHVSMSGSAIYQPLLLLPSTNSLQFNQTYLGQISSRQFNIDIIGTGSETLTFSNNLSDFYVASGNITNITGGTNWRLIVGFAPTTVGSKIDTLNYSSSGGATGSISLNGTATRQPIVLSTSVDSVAFSNTVVNTLASSSIQVWGSNTGTTETVTITDNSANFYATTSSVIVTGDGGVTKQTINLRFLPNATGSFSGTLTLSSSGGNIKTVGLTGTAVEQYYNNTTLLLRGEGSNGSTSIIDSSVNNSTISRFGNTMISTAQSKYGGSSIYFDGNGDYLTIPNSTNYDFGTENFTIEMWVNPSAVGLVTGDQKHLFGKRATSLSYASVLGWLTYSSVTSNFSVSFFRSTNGASYSIQYTSPATFVSPNVWTHLAFVRNGNEYSVFVNGIKYVAAASSSGIVYNDTSAFAVGSTFSGISPSTRAFSGYIDDFRVTKGIARYTSNFTPPGAL